MVLRPFSATLQKQFRDTLETPGSPSLIDDETPVQAVAVVAQVNTASSAGYVQVTDGTDTLAINTNGSINIGQTIPSGATLIRKQMYCSFAGAEAQDIYTVTGGKTLYITNMTLSSPNTVQYNVGDAIAAASSADTLRDNVVAHIQAIGTVSLSFVPPVTISTKVTAYAAAAGGVGVAFTGWEV